MVALVRTDIVDSTGFMATRGVQAAIEARTRSQHLIERACTAGEILDTRGDGLLIGFDSAAAALLAAFAVQQAAGHESDFELRVAVTIGQTAIDGTVGGSLEERSRAIEVVCPPGQVLIDSLVRRCVQGFDGFNLESFPTPAPGQHFRRLTAVPDLSADFLSQVSLCAVLFSDLAPIEQSTGSENTSRLQTISQDSITRHGGALLDTNGAGNVAAFRSCSLALNAAETMHAQATSAAMRASTTGSFEFKVGIAVGEIVTSEAGGFGLALTEAARLLAIAQNRSTCISRSVLTVAEADTTQWVDVGEQTLAGLPETVSALSVQAPVAPPALLELPMTFRHDPTFSLVGRTQSLAQLSNIWQSAASGVTQAVVVSGEEGIGKTRLVRELACRAHLDGALVLHGACDEDLRVAYAPVADAIRRAASLDGDLLAAINDGTGGLGPLMSPATTQQHGAQSLTASEGPDQFELFDQVGQVLDRLAEQRPVLLIIDDIQWGLTDTLRLIEHVYSRPETARVAIVATCRAEHLDDSPSVQLLLNAAREGHRVSHLRLDRLDEASVTAILETRTQRPLNGDEASVASEVTRITGGSPLYIEELIAHLAATGVFEQDAEQRWSLGSAPDEVPIPDSVINLMAHRAGRLGPDALKLLSTAAIIGSTFELDLLSKVLEQPIDQVIKVIDAATTARLIRQADAIDSYEFSDEIARSAVLRDVSGASQSVIHGLVAEQLEQLQPHAIDRLAAHWSAALGADARTGAMRYLRLTAERDMAAAAWESASERYRQVITLADIAGGVDEVILGDVHYGLGLSLRKLGDDGYRPALLHAATIARCASNADLLARCAMAMMRPGAWYSEADVVDHEIVAMCEDSLLFLDAADPMRPRVLAALAVNLTYAGDPDRRMELVTEAQRLANDIGDLRLIGTTLSAELIAFHEPDRFERRRELADQVRRIGRATSDRELLFAGSWFVVLDLMATGDIKAAQRLVTELAPVVEAAREFWPSFVMSHFETALSIARCEDGAPQLIEQERQAFEQHPVDSFGVFVIQTAAVAVGHGTLSDMLLSLVEAADEHGSDDWAKKWNYALSRAYLDAGDHDAALAAIAMNPELDLDYYWLSSTYHLGMLGLRVQRPDLCHQVLDKLSAYRGRIGLIGLGACFAGQISTALGQAHLGLGQFAEAQELFRESVVQADQCGFTYFATNARRFLAEALLRADPASAEARVLIDTVLEVAERKNFALEIKGANKLAAALTSTAPN